MSYLVGNHIVGLSMRRLIYIVKEERISAVAAIAYMYNEILSAR